MVRKLATGLTDINIAYDSHLRPKQFSMSLSLIVITFDAFY
jgi:hypothetical protein